MKDINYTYNDSSYILEKITPISNDNIIILIIFIIIIVFIFLFVFYIIPILIGIKRQMDKGKIKNKQSEILRKMKMQKDLEDEILNNL